MDVNENSHCDINCIQSKKDTIVIHYTDPHGIDGFIELEMNEAARLVEAILDRGFA